MDSVLFFSIIIPVYNTDDYIANCLESIKRQDAELFKYEIIIIDDGSTDNSYSILLDYVNQFEHLQLIQKKNEGVSIARNIGINKANGKYILFVDSDDLLGDDTLLKLYVELNQDKKDLLIGKSFTINNNFIGKERYQFPQYFLDNSYSGITLIINNNYNRGSACGVVFSKEFIDKNDLRFSPILKNGEDSLFMLECFIQAQRIGFIYAAVYLIREREHSASRNLDFGRVLAMTNNLKEIKNILNLNTWTFDQKSIIQFGIYLTISNIFYLLYYCFSIRRYFKIRKAINSMDLFRISTGRIKLCKSKVRIYNLSIDMFAFLVLMRQFLKGSYNRNA